MAPLILNLLQISIIMSVAAVILHLVMNVFSNSIPPKWKYYIWGIVLVSLLIPFRPRFTDPIVTVDAPEQVSEKTAGESAAATAESSTSFLSQLDIPMILLCVWIAGIVIFLGIVFVRHMRFMRTAKRWGTRLDDSQTMDFVKDTMANMNITTEIEVIRSKMVSVPMMAGVFSPVLFLPVYDLDEEELEYVIRHELVHYRKFDILLKLLSVLANAVHWFNPLVYLMQRWIYTDCEVACDYEVTKSYEHDERIRYVETIIGVAKHEIKYKTVFSTNFYDGKKTMKKRLESVLSDNKTRTALVVVVVAALIVTCIAAGSALAVSTGDEENVPYIGENKAKEIALEKTGGGELITFSFDDNSGSRVYNIEIADDNNNYIMTMDAKSGDILTYEKTPKEPASASNDSQNTGDDSGSLISASKAKSIALSRVGGGTVTECNLDSDDGTKKYEIKITWNGYEYEVDVNAKSGKVTDFDKEKIEDDDDDD